MNSNLKIVIVEDEVLIAEFIKDILLSFNFTEVKLAHNKKQARSLLTDFFPDAVLLDIRMKGELDGIELANEINEKYKIPFVFISAHSDREIIEKAINTKPITYITKPIKEADVFAAIQLVKQKLKDDAAYFLLIKNGYENIKLFFDDILYVKSDDNYIHIFTTDDKHTIRNSLEWFKDNIKSNFFQRAHRSYIVNKSKITKTKSKSVFIGDIEIPLSRGHQIKLD